MPDVVTPAGWPAGVRPPGSPDWERSAVNWLFDHCPPEYRGYDVLRANPVILARFAAHATAAAGRAAHDGLATARVDLSGVVPPEVVTAAIACWEMEGARLLRLRREVELVEQALRGRTFRSRL